MARKRKEAVCLRKVRYKFEEDAADAAKYMVKHRGWPQRAYLCNVCHGWHLTTKVKNVR